MDGLGRKESRAVETSLSLIDSFTLEFTGSTARDKRIYKWIYKMM